MLITVVVFFAIFVQAVTGFGLALVSMTILAGIIGVRTAAPLVALVALVAEVVILLRYREALSLRAVVRFTVAALPGIPVGIVALRWVDAGILTTTLGIIITLYALYALLTPRLPELNHPAWAVGLGFLAGLFGGASNISGPPIIIYGTCRRWPVATFKSNLQGFFLVTSVITLGGYALGGLITRLVWQDFLLALPGVALGLIAGFRLDGRLNPARFRQAIMVLLLVLGGRLILGG